MDRLTITQLIKIIKTYCNFSNKIFFSVEAQNYRIWCSENSQIIEERPLDPEKVIVWGVLWSEGSIGWDAAQYVSKSDRKLSQKIQC